MADSVTIHGSCVAIAGKAVLIIGASGAGKSSLALQLMALGARLVADDQTVLRKHEDVLIADAPDTIRGRIEARGVGLIRAPDAGPTPLSLIVDLSQSETQRLPEAHCHTVLGMRMPCLHNANSPHFASAIWLSMQGTLDTSP